MIDLPEDLRAAMNQQPRAVINLVDPVTQNRFVLVRSEEYDRLNESASPGEPTQIPPRFSFDPIEKIRAAFDVPGEIRIIPDAPDFAVSDQGDIFRIHKDGQVTKRFFSPSKDGYVHYRLDRPDGSSKGGTLNNLVLQVFEPRARHQGDQARHKDGNKLNNSLSNLHWGTHQENMNDRDRHGKNPMYGSKNPRAKLVEEEAKEIRRFIAQGMSRKDIAIRFGISASAVGKIMKGRSWKHVV